MKICEIVILTYSSHELFITVVFNLNFNILAIMNNTISKMVGLPCLKCDIKVGHTYSHIVTNI